MRAPKRKILLVSTDPAHSIADVLQFDFEDKAKRVRGAGKLFARQIDPERQVKRFLDEEREGLLKVVESGTFFTRREIEPLLNATLPGMAEVASLVALHELIAANDYDEIVVDTAPMGHTLRLFQMPEYFANFLAFLQTAASRDELLAQRFARRTLARNPFITKWQRMLDLVRSVLSGRDSRLILVTTPEPFALNESTRAREWLRSGDLHLEIGEIVLNRAVVKTTNCPNCRIRAEAAKSAVPRLRKEFSDCEILMGEDAGGPIVGTTALREFGAHVFERRRLQYKPVPPKTLLPKFKRADWPTLQTPISCTLGKGGVGKTTISAALGLNQRRVEPSRGVTICSTDPAPSLHDVFDCEVGDAPRPVLGDAKLEAAEFDAVEHYRTWADDIKSRIAGAMSGQSEGIHLDLSFDREVLTALLAIVPPGVDEIFATFRILDLLKPGERMVIDMAPTGHALELLRTPERMLTWIRLLLKTLAAHRTLPLAQDAAVELATVAQKVRELSEKLRDPDLCSVWPVMLAEPLPDRETERLLDELEKLQAPVAALFVNRILFPEQAGRCLRCRREREWQLSILAQVKKRFHNVLLYVVRNVPGGIAGKRALRSFTSELWLME